MATILETPPAGKVRPGALTEDEATALARRIAGLEALSTPELRLLYAEAFGERSNSRNRVYLQRRIAWRLQERAYGSLSERASRRAKELACDADLRVTVPRGDVVPMPPPVPATVAAPARRRGKPAPGQILTRDYNGKRYEVRVVEGGFLYAGQVYTSLSAIANRITGSHWSGNAFFNIRRAKGTE